LATRTGRFGAELIAAGAGGTAPERIRPITHRAAARNAARNAIAGDNRSCCVVSLGLFRKTSDLMRYGPGINNFPTTEITLGFDATDRASARAGGAGAGGGTTSSVLLNRWTSIAWVK